MGPNTGMHPDAEISRATVPLRGAQQPNGLIMHMSELRKTKLYCMIALSPRHTVHDNRAEADNSSLETLAGAIVTIDPKQNVTIRKYFFFTRSRLLYAGSLQSTSWRSHERVHMKNCTKNIACG